MNYFFVVAALLLITYASCLKTSKCHIIEEPTSLTIQNRRDVVIDFKTKLDDGKWAAFAIGNGTNMQDLHAFVISRTGTHLTFRTGITKGFGKIEFDKTESIPVTTSLKGDLAHVTVQLAMHSADPSRVVLDQCQKFHVVSAGLVNNVGDIQKHQDKILSGVLCADTCGPVN
ncbi:unnamed protein product [Caenorhabditis bovis]|uniref:DOMON domain-containing protein n=1 Tax=Caenorhabditis bovis TaxID=2654633 RepID=A0A8S1F5B7_9PELO|nr:unnamed protein product [Caenorhabditis bovis]